MAKKDTIEKNHVNERRSAALRADAIAGLGLRSDAIQLLPLVERHVHDNGASKALNWPLQRVAEARANLFKGLKVTNCDAARRKIKTLGT